MGCGSSKPPITFLEDRTPHIQRQDHFQPAKVEVLKTIPSKEDGDLEKVSIPLADSHDIHGTSGSSAVVALSAVQDEEGNYPSKTSSQDIDTDQTQETSSNAVELVNLNNETDAPQCEERSTVPPPEKNAPEDSVLSLPQNGDNQENPDSQSFPTAANDTRPDEMIDQQKESIVHSQSSAKDVTLLTTAPSDENLATLTHEHIDTSIQPKVLDTPSYMASSPSAPVPLGQPPSQPLNLDPTMQDSHPESMPEEPPLMPEDALLETLAKIDKHDEVMYMPPENSSIAVHSPEFRDDDPRIEVESRTEETDAVESLHEPHEGEMTPLVEAPVSQVECMDMSEEDEHASNESESFKVPITVENSPQDKEEEVKIEQQQQEEEDHHQSGVSPKGDGVSTEERNKEEGPPTMPVDLTLIQPNLGKRADSKRYLDMVEADAQSVSPSMVSKRQSAKNRVDASDTSCVSSSASMDKKPMSPETYSEQKKRRKDKIILTKLSSQADKVTAMKAYKLFNHDPWSDQSSYEDTQVQQMIHDHPFVCSLMYVFEGFSNPHFPLAMLCALGASLDTVQSCWEAFPEALEHRDGDIGTILHYACSYKSSKEVVSFLLEKDSTLPSQTNDSGHYPLHSACLFGSSVSVIELLLDEYGDALQHCDCDGMYPLHLACENNASEDVISSLVNAYPLACETKSRLGHTPLHLAAMSVASFAVIQALVSANSSSLSLPDEEGYLPLHYAAATGLDVTALQCIVNAYPDGLSIQSSQGEIPLEMAISSGINDAAVLDLLGRRRDADPSE